MEKKSPPLPAGTAIVALSTTVESEPLPWMLFTKTGSNSDTLVCTILIVVLGQLIAVAKGESSCSSSDEMLPEA
ncbi:MAG: hypothetical protein GWO08_03050 [Gammaproteobacteria bacterium]|nr:hypothetical protein [Gammaproteobacteria bacterium]NIR92666.1 hypothetical protein [Gammaproteobacteria bacterium]